MNLFYLVCYLVLSFCSLEKSQFFTVASTLTYRRQTSENFQLNTTSLNSNKESISTEKSELSNVGASTIETKITTNSFEARNNTTESQNVKTTHIELTTPLASTRYTDEPTTVSARISPTTSKVKHERKSKPLLTLIGDERVENYPRTFILSDMMARDASDPRRALPLVPKSKNTTKNPEVTTNSATVPKKITEKTTKKPKTKKKNETLIVKTTAILKNSTTSTIKLKNSTELNNTTKKPHMVLPSYLYIYTMENGTKSVYVMCRALPFCKWTAWGQCRNVKIKNCDSCSKWQFSLFLSCVLLLGGLIVVGNLCVLSYCWKEKQNSSTYLSCKASLAFTDILTGLFVFMFFLPNIVSAWNSTMFQTTIPTSKEKGTLSNAIKGIIFLVIFQSNFYQLTAIAVVRLLDIVFPWKRLSEGKTHVILITVWALSVVSSTIPTWFPYTFEFNYTPDLFITWINIRTNPGGYSGTEKGISAPTIVLSLFLIIIPYIVSLVSCIALLVFVKIQLNKSRKLTSQVETINKKEQKATISIVVKVLGFTVTTLPFLIRVAYDTWFKRQNCKTDEVSLPITFYIFFSRSLVNVIVYLTNDEKFRNFVLCKKTAKKVSFGASSVQSFETDTTTVVDDEDIKEKSKTVTKVKRLKIKESKIKVVEENAKQENKDDIKQGSVDEKVETKNETDKGETVTENNQKEEAKPVEGNDNEAFEKE